MGGRPLTTPNTLAISRSLSILSARSFSRSTDAGSGSSSVGKAAVGGGVTVNITGPTADQIIAIVDGNMRNNGVLRR